MRILLYGATGTLGQRILNEALDRGHEVTAVARPVPHSAGARCPEPAG
jgi:putative NADH-flavin reductase